MLGAFQAVTKIVRRTTRARRTRARAEIREVLQQLKALKAEFRRIKSEYPLLDQQDVLVKMFHADVLAARKLYAEHRKPDANSHRASAAATLICIERNEKAKRLDPNVRFIVN